MADTFFRKRFIAATRVKLRGSMYSACRYGIVHGCAGRAPVAEVPTEKDVCVCVSEVSESVAVDPIHLAPTQNHALHALIPKTPDAPPTPPPRWRRAARCAANTSANKAANRQPVSAPQMADLGGFGAPERWHAPPNSVLSAQFSLYGPRMHSHRGPMRSTAWYELVL